MTLREKQSIFALNVSKLISYAYENGFEITLGEAQRTLDQQRLYFEGYTLLKVESKLKLAKTSHKSKTLHSKHLKKLAIDLNVFKDGVYLLNKKDIQKLGDYWESLDSRNAWGGNFKTFLDVPHFQMNEK